MFVLYACCKKRCVVLTCCIFPHVEFRVIYFPRSSIWCSIFPCVEFRVIFFCVWNALWYCGISCYIFSACLTRSGVVEFCVIFFCVWNSLWYCGILCYIFPYIESSGGDNSTCLCTCVLYFSCCIFRFVLKPLHSLQQLLLIQFWKIFSQTLKKTVFYDLSK